MHLLQRDPPAGEPSKDDPPAFRTKIAGDVVMLIHDWGPRAVTTFRSRREMKSTGGRGRTDTPLREQDFESSASANFATPAFFKRRKLGGAHPGGKRVVRPPCLQGVIKCESAI